MTATGWLHLGSCFYLALVVTLILGIIESDSLGEIWRPTLRRWLQLIGALILLAIVVQTCTFVTDKNTATQKKDLTQPEKKNTDRVR